MANAALTTPPPFTAPAPAPSPAAFDQATESLAIPLGAPQSHPTMISVRARVLCIAGTDVGRTFHIDQWPATLGRSSCTVTLRGTDVSRAHARISASGDAYEVEDLNSSNGTFVNGAAVEGRASLHIGDQIRVGATLLVFARHDELEARTREEAQAEAMSTALSGMAHDFRNALQIVLVGLDQLDQLEGDAQRAAVDQMRVAASGASNLAARLINLGRTPSACARVQLGALLAETAAMCSSLLGPGVTVSVVGDASGTVLADRDELQHAFINILLNARDAMPDGGAITIASQPLLLDRLSALRRHLPSEGAYVEVSITDTGLGMSEATKARAFEPFFTTKSPGHGTGLGLATVHSVVRRVGGAVSIDSVLGRGSTVRLVLPQTRRV